MESPGIENRSGEIYSIGDPDKWFSLMLVKGHVLEVWLQATEWESPPGLEVGLLVPSVSLGKNGEMSACVKSLGCSDVDVTRRLSNVFNRRVGWVHLCGEDPCPSKGNFAMHVKRFRLHHREDFHRSYITDHIRRSVAKWVEEDVEAPDDLDGEPLDKEDNEEYSPTTPRDEPMEPKEKKQPAQAGKEPKAAKLDARPKPGSHSERHPKEPKRKRGGAPEIDRAMLRQRLNSARERMLLQGGEAKAPGGRPNQADAMMVESSPPETLDFAAPERAQIEYPPPVGEVAPLRKRKHSTSQPLQQPERGEVLQRQRKSRASPVRALGDVENRGQGATSAGSMKSFQGQLVAQAQENAKLKARQKKEEIKKHQKKDPTMQLAKILTQVVAGSGHQGSQLPPNHNPSSSSRPKVVKKEKKEQKEKKRKKRKKDPSDGGDPGGSSDDDQTDSWNENYGNDWEESSSSGESKKMLGPLRRKSKEKPGSVLQALVDHARTQLDQSSKVQVGRQSDITLTQGVKIGSYFAIVVRPQLGNSMAQVRELHHLSQCLDLLRQGDLSLLGDTLAGRFMSIHQSVLDGGWRTARQLELTPYEEGTAAAPEVILQARKQAKLAEKLAPGDTWHWNSGRGRGGKGRGSGWGDSQQDAKGKGKKGGKTKGKYKGGNNWDEKGTDGKTREKLPEKTG